MKRYIFTILLLFPIVLFSQTIDLRIPTSIGSSENADALGDKAPSYYVDTATVQDIHGEKTIKDDLVLDSTLSIGVPSPDATSIIEIVSTTKGVLQPRMTDVQRDAISTPAEGLELYDLTGNVPNFYNGTAWRRFSHTTSASLEEGGVVISEVAKGSSIMTDSANFYWDNTAKNLGIGTSTPEFKLSLDNDGAIIAIGTFGSGDTVTTAGSGSRMIWYPRKAAFRAGHVSGTQWDNANVGDYSFAVGQSTIASGSTSFATGLSTTANGIISTAMGWATTASGLYSTAMGANTIASNSYSTAMGESSIASGSYSIASGDHTTASGLASVTMGRWVTAGGANNTIVLGQGVSDGTRLVNNITSSLMVGFNSDIPTLFVGTSSGVGTTGNVGIGTATPDNALDVDGFIEYDNKAVTLGSGVTTFVATSNGMTMTGHGSGNTIATITGVTNGGFLTLIFTNNKITITDDNTHAADSIDLNASFTSVDDVVIRLEHDGTSWYEVSRSTN